MSVANFIPTIWEARLLANFYERSIAGLITTPPTEIKGNKIVFGSVSNVAVKDYEGKVVWDDLDIPDTEMEMNIEKYWAFKLDDVDRVQANAELIDTHTIEAASQTQCVIDKEVLDEGLKTTLVVTKESSDKAYDLIVKSNTLLNKKKVDKINRFSVINAEVLESLCLDERFTRHYQILENGIIEGANINGTQLIFSEELNAGKFAILTLHKTALGFGTQLNETEAMRLENAFADGIRGLQVAGAKLLRPNAAVKYVETTTPSVE
ncbi:hypothetical protein OCS97_012645 [Clostridioides difficile]|uniref:hypothetical protein n=1 Tax=Clostridioides difficile TaxID=1496 RepID=UPI003059FA57|nr:hypothetical protein [Clostridioides difficile]